MNQLHSYPVWDRNVRWFHWINVLTILGLAIIGLIILNAGALDISNAGKVKLKVLHTWIGYVFALNLLWRLVWGFLGNRYARWRNVLPVGKSYWSALRSYLASFRGASAQYYAGHNPLGRLSVTLLVLLLLVQAVTGLILAGTDIFYPPIGHWIAEWVAAPGISPATLVPYAPEMYDAAAYSEMRSFRKPVITIHLYNFYTLMAVIVLHIAAVVITDIKERSGVVSAMFNGQKHLPGKAEDA